MFVCTDQSPSRASELVSLAPWHRKPDLAIETCHCRASGYRARKRPHPTSHARPAPCTGSGAVRPATAHSGPAPPPRTALTAGGASARAHSPPGLSEGRPRATRAPATSARSATRLSAISSRRQTTCPHRRTCTHAQPSSPATWCAGAARPWPPHTSLSEPNALSAAPTASSGCWDKAASTTRRPTHLPSGCTHWRCVSPSFQLTFCPRSSGGGTRHDTRRRPFLERLRECVWGVLINTPTVPN